MTPKVTTSGIDFSRLNGQSSSSTLNLPSDFLQIFLMALTGLLQEKGGGEPKTSDLSSASVPDPSFTPPPGPDLKGNGNPSPSEEEEKLNPQDLLRILQGASGITGEGIESPRPSSENVLSEVKGETGEMATSRSHKKLARIFEEAIRVSSMSSGSSEGPEGKDLESFGRIESPGIWEMFQRIAESPAQNPLEGEGVAEIPSVPFLNLRKEFEVKERAGKEGKRVSEIFREIFSRGPGKFESEAPDVVALWNFRKNFAEDTGQTPNPRLEIPSPERPQHEGFYQEMSDPRVGRPTSERAQEQGLYPKTETLKTVTPEGAFKTPSQREGLRVESRKAEEVFSSRGPEKERLKIRAQENEDLADVPVSGPERNRVLRGDRGSISLRDITEAPYPRLEIPSPERPQHEGFYQEMSDPRVERPTSERAQEQGLYPKTEALKTVTPEGAFQTASQKKGWKIKPRESEDLADLSVFGPERHRVPTGDRGPISLRDIAEAPPSISNFGDPVSPERVEQIIKDLVYEIRPSGEKKARIKLEPPELGEMEIDLKVHDKKVEILLKVERLEAARELHLHLSHLKHSLEEMGLNLSEFQVTFLGSEGGGSAYSFRDAEEQKRNPAGIEREDFSGESTVNEGQREGLLNIVI